MIGTTTGSILRDIRYFASGTSYYILWCCRLCGTWQASSVWHITGRLKDDV